jgi:hypothetical protein
VALGVADGLVQAIYPIACSRKLAAPPTGAGAGVVVERAHPTGTRAARAGTPGYADPNRQSCDSRYG